MILLPSPEKKEETKGEDGILQGCRMHPASSRVSSNLKIRVLLSGTSPTREREAFQKKKPGILRRHLHSGHHLLWAPVGLKDRHKGKSNRETSTAIQEVRGRKRGAKVTHFFSSSLLPAPSSLGASSIGRISAPSLFSIEELTRKRTAGKKELGSMTPIEKRGDRRPQDVEHKKSTQKQKWEIFTTFL